MKNLGDVGPLTQSEDKIENEFEEEKKIFYSNLRENLRLKLEIELETKILNSKEKNFSQLENTLKTIEDQMQSKPDFSDIDKNLEVMQSKLKIMKREMKHI